MLGKGGGGHTEVKIIQEKYAITVTPALIIKKYIQYPTADDTKLICTLRDKMLTISYKTLNTKIYIKSKTEINMIGSHNVVFILVSAFLLHYTCMLIVNIYCFFTVKMLNVC